jgi:hypothetical protein
LIEYPRLKQQGIFDSVQDYTFYANPAANSWECAPEFNPDKSWVKAELIKRPDSFIPFE